MLAELIDTARWLSFSNAFHIAALRVVGNEVADDDLRRRFTTNSVIGCISDAIGPDDGFPKV
jgi:hypothetical protein